MMYCFEINLVQKKYKSIAEHTYDFSGHIIDKRTSTSNVWESIPPYSVMEFMHNAIKRRTNNRIIDNTYYDAGNLE